MVLPEYLLGSVLAGPPHFGQHSVPIADICMKQGLKDRALQDFLPQWVSCRALGLMSGQPHAVVLGSAEKFTLFADLSHLCAEQR